MHPYFARLGIRPEVQTYFRPFYTLDPHGHLVFTYGDDFEHFGPGFHRVPRTATFWTAGETAFSQVRQVIVCPSAMDAVAWLHKHWNVPLENLLLLSTGASLHHSHTRFIARQLAGKELHIATGQDLLDKLTALKLAAGIRGQPLEIWHTAGETITLRFRAGTYRFPQATISLHALEKASGYRFRISISKQPKINIHA